MNFQTPSFQRHGVPQTPFNDILKKNTIKVFCRQRKLQRTERKCFIQQDIHTIKLIDPSQKSSNIYKLDHIFSDNASHSDVFGISVKPLVQSFMTEQKNALLFAYGPTGSGKTYTIDEMVKLSLNEIFSYLQQSNNKKFHLKLSYIEIYQNKFYDLLTREKTYDNNTLEEVKNALNFREGRGIIEKLKKCEAKSIPKCLDEFNFGKENRTIHSTKLNKDSSRSHCILTFHLFYSGSEISKFSIVDLAGSENAKKTSNSRTRQVETNIIHQNLFTLKKCIETIRLNNKRSRKKIVPFRESSLTKFLKTFLSDDTAKISVILTIYPKTQCHIETSRALEFASVAKRTIPMSTVPSSRIKRVIPKLEKSKSKKVLVVENPYFQRSYYELSDSYDQMCDRYDESILEMEISHHEAKKELLQQQNEKILYLQTKYNEMGKEYSDYINKVKMKKRDTIVEKKKVQEQTEFQNDHYHKKILYLTKEKLSVENEMKKQIEVKQKELDLKNKELEDVLNDFQRRKSEFEISSKRNAQLESLVKSLRLQDRCDTKKKVNFLLVVNNSSNEEDQRKLIKIGSNDKIIPPHLFRKIRKKRKVKRKRKRKRKRNEDDESFDEENDENIPPKKKRKVQKTVRKFCDVK